MLLAGIEAVIFDAVGTIIHPEPPAPHVYAEVGRHFGSSYSIETIAARFLDAFRKEEDWDQANGLRTSEVREVERWQRIVGNVLDDATDAEACFQALFEHFRKPQAWRCKRDAAATLQGLHRRGVVLGLASNYDSRLRNVVGAMSGLKPFTHVVISAEVGWRKPAPEFFAAVCRRVGRPANRILFIGDDLVNDYQGADAAGLRALLFDPRGKELTLPRIESLQDLLEP
jgi:putative hydrolase of the HAD superfamily